MRVQRRNDQVHHVLGRLSEDDVGAGERGRLLARLASLLAGQAGTAGGRALAGGRWLADLVLEIAPHIGVRDRATLRAHYGGRMGDELAEALVSTASRATAAVGFAGGALAAAEWAAPPTLLSAPLQVAAETVAVVAIELKLVAELHQVYGHAPTGTPAQRTTAYVLSWVRRRGVDPLSPGGVSSALGTAARRELRARVVRRFGRNLGTIAPLLAGAAAGAELNRRDTRKLGAAVRADLRSRHQR